MVLNLGVGWALCCWEGRWWSLPLIFLSWAFIWVYSYAPFKLSSRGGGELVQALGVGLLLLFFGYYAQAGTACDFPWNYLVFVLPLQLGSALATALPDEPSDRLGHKHTLVVLLGPGPVKRLIVLPHLVGLACFCPSAGMDRNRQKVVFSWVTRYLLPCSWLC